MTGLPSTFICVYWLAVGLTVGGEVRFPDLPSASSTGSAIQSPFTNSALAALGDSFAALVDNPNHRGPNQETQQLVVFRCGPTSFQVLRKWLTRGGAKTDEPLNLQWDPDYFDEVVSVVSNQAFGAIIPTQNILEYRSLEGTVLDEVKGLDSRSLQGEKNLLLRNIKLEQALYSSISLCGIPMVVQVNASLGDGRYSVQTFQTNDATLEADSGSKDDGYTFRLISGGVEKARSLFRAAPMYTSNNFPKVILLSEKRSGDSGEWKLGLAARLFTIPDTFPAIEVIHSQMLSQAFTSGRFAHRDSYSNGVIYSIPKAGIPVPISTRPMTSEPSRQSRTIVVRVLLAGLTLAGLAFLLKFSLKPANKQ